MSLKNVGDYEESYNDISPTRRSSVPTQPLLSRNNPIQLAAMSNYKLAQLTFSAPDWNSMRKTALIKNMTDVIYKDTPPEWLDQMRRWLFFTPESLSDMTQDGLELIFGQYIQTMEAFRPINLNDIDDDDDEEDDEDDELWPEDEIQTPNDFQPALYENVSASSTSAPIIMEYPLYAHSGASLSAELLAQKDVKPLPDRPTSPTSTTLQTRKLTATATSPTTSQRKQQHRKSMAKMRNRLSWTSDTGLLANSAMGQTWANELMTMFNMEFQVDTSLNLNTTTAPAPTLPELPFSARHNQQKRQSHRKSQRYSTDSFMNLIPAFESFKLEEPIERRSVMISRSKTITFPPPPPTTPPPHLMAGSISSSSSSSSRQRSSSQPEIYQHDPNTSKTIVTPIRSSSLKIKSRSRPRLRSLSAKDTSPKSKSSTDTMLDGLVNAFGSGATNPGEKRSLSKKRSIRRLASLVTGTKSKYGHNGENHNKNNIDDSSEKQPSPAVEATTATSTCISSPPSTNSLKRTSFSTNIYQTPLSPTHSSAPMTSGNNTSHLSIASTTESSASTHSMLMVATKTPMFQYKPLPDIPSACTNDDNSNNNNNQRRTSCTMARPVIVELGDLRRSRSTGYRPMKKRNPVHWKRRRSEDDTPPLTTTDSSSRPLESMRTTTTSSSTATSAATGQPPSYTLSDPPVDVNSALLSTLPQPKRSKSTLRRIGSGLSKQHKKLLTRKNDSVLSPPLVNETEPHITGENNNSNTFVKRMASFRKRMKLQRG